MAHSISSNCIGLGALEYSGFIMLWPHAIENANFTYVFKINYFNLLCSWFWFYFSIIISADHFELWFYTQLSNSDIQIIMIYIFPNMVLFRILQESQCHLDDNPILWASIMGSLTGLGSWAWWPQICGGYVISVPWDTARYSKTCM